jgi:outer membrane lipoprotein-sorting protein
MKKLMMLLILVSAVSAQNKDPQKLLDAVMNRFNKVRDYQASIVVKLDMEMVKVPESKARVYFKQPDKFKIVSEGFSMLPKQATKFSPTQLLNFDYTPVYVRAETIDNQKLDVVKIVPNSDTSDVILSTMWIDPKESIVRKVETSTRRGGTVVTELKYDAISIPLPIFLKFSFNLGEVELPKSPSSNQQSNNQQSGMHTAKLKGSVLMSYSDYKINKGIDDKFFEEDKKEKTKIK